MTTVEGNRNPAFQTESGAQLLETPVLDENILKMANSYAEMLLAWNKSINLTGAESIDRIMTDLLMDSFYLAVFLDEIYPNNFCGECWDFGAGAGLPGIPLRMVWQKGNYAMIEAREKRALFLSNVLSRLELPRTRVFRGTVQNFVKNGGKADCIISRAFMPWQQLVNFCAPLLQSEGKIIIMANKEAPIPPEGWRLEKQAFYHVAGKTRWLWAFSPGL